MAVPNRRPSVAQEQSLLRSFGAIHHSSPSPSSTHHAACEGAATSSSSLKRDRRGKARAVTPPPLPRPEEMPSLPFSRDDVDDFDVERRQPQQQLQREASRSRSRDRARKFQRRSSAINAEQAKEMVARLAGEKRRASRRATVAETSPYAETKVPAERGASQYRGFRGDYSLGDALRHPSHMVVPSSPQEAARSARSMSKHDFAFVRRSNGEFSYSILAYRSTAPIKGSREGETEETMVFVMTDDGSTKMVRRGHWNDYVRLVAAQDPSPASSEEKAAKARSASPKCPPALEEQLKLERTAQFPCREIPVCKEIEVLDELNEDFVPDMIVFDRSEVADEECSLISSVSDRARMSRPAGR